MSALTQLVEYRELPGFPGYRAGNDGSIWSCWKANGRGQQIMGGKWKRLRGAPRKEDGRLRYTLRTASGEYRRAYGSNFILEAFAGPCPEGLEACHENGDCLNDSPSNLRWDTHSSNLLDKRRHGTADPEKHPKAKLKNEDITTIIDLRANGQRLKAIAERFGVSEQRVFQICKKGSR